MIALWVVLIALGLVISLIVKIRAAVGFVIVSFLDGLLSTGMSRDAVLCFWGFIGCLLADAGMIYALTYVLK